MLISYLYFLNLHQLLGISCSCFSCLVDWSYSWFYLMLTIKRCVSVLILYHVQKKVWKEEPTLYTKQPKRQSKMEKRYSLFDRENDIPFVTVIIVLQWWSFFLFFFIFILMEKYYIMSLAKYFLFCKIKIKSILWGFENCPLFL